MEKTSYLYKSNHQINFYKIIATILLGCQSAVLFSPMTALAASTSPIASDISNSLESVGTKASRIKTSGSSGVDESTGAFTYSYDINLPKGTLGMQPTLALDYNSSNYESGVVGYGWNMNTPYIEKTSKYGVDKIFTRSDLVSSVGGELILKSGTTNEYIQKIDDGSYQLYTFKNSTFTLKDRSGNTYTYGGTLDSRLSDGVNISRYYITESRDVLGNRVKYYYDNKNNFVYPKEIIYTVKKMAHMIIE